MDNSIRASKPPALDCRLFAGGLLTIRELRTPQASQPTVHKRVLGQEGFTSVNRARRYLRGTGIAALLFTVAACSSSAKNSSTSPTAGSQGSTGGTQATTGGTQAPAGEPITVGLVCSCSGPFGAASVPGQDVYKAWVNTVNASGGINGHTIKLITEDDAATPGTAISEVQTLISDHVDAIVDLSQVDTAWASAVQTANIPVVGGYATDEPFFTNPDFYGMGETGDSAVTAYVLTIKAAGGTSFGDMVCAEAVVCQQYEQGL